MRLTLSVLATAILCTVAGPVASAGAACPAVVSTPLAQAPINGTALCTTPAELAFGSTTFSYVRDGATVTPKRENLTLSVFRPAVPIPGAPSPADNFAANDTRRPVILWVHGGSFLGGDPSELAPYAKLFASYGFVSVLPRYAFVPRTDLTNDGVKTDLTLESVSQAAQRDIQTAVRYLRARSTDLGINGRAIYVAGASAGGIAAVRLATRSQDDDRGARDHLVDAGGNQTATLAAGAPSSPAGSQLNQSSAIAGAVAISAMECFPGRPATLKFIFGTRTMQSGRCQVDTDPTGDAPIWMLGGQWDQIVQKVWSESTCLTAYRALCGPNRFTTYQRYDRIYDEGPTHTDGSYGSCKPSPQVNGMWWIRGIDSSPGGDHLISDVATCPARTGVDPDGTLTDGAFRNLNRDRRFRTLALNVYQALQPLALTAPTS